jgi:hypothetical protein
MTVNGLKLPDAFVALIDRPKPLIRWNAKGDPEAWSYKGGEGGLYWVPIEDANSDDGLPDLDLFSSQAKIERETNRLPKTFHVADCLPEESAEWESRNAHRPGFLPLITDYSKIVYFGDTDTGPAFCFDYRENADEPAVIQWYDGWASWRRFAPNFDYFMSLFEPWVSRDER